MEQKILIKNQEKFLKIFGEEKTLAESFYLSEGTALAAYYLFHRLSEDPEFFYEHEFDSQIVSVFLKKNPSKKSKERSDAASVSLTYRTYHLQVMSCSSWLHKNLLVLGTSFIII